jgi:hypothetical protein
MCLSPIKHAATSERSDLNFFEGLAGPLLYRRFQAVPSTEARRASKKGLVRLGVDLLSGPGSTDPRTVFSGFFLSPARIAIR